MVKRMMASSNGLADDHCQHQNDSSGDQPEAEVRLSLAQRDESTSRMTKAVQQRTVLACH